MTGASIVGPPARSALRALAAAAFCLAVAACGGGPQLDVDSALAKAPTEKTGPASGNELAKATDYSAKEYAKNPHDAKAALSYAQNLKAMGEKRQALAVLQQATSANSQDRALISEYGRLALELDQIGVAEKLLPHADDPTNPDWRVISARGTVLAKQGKYGEAIPFYERALALAPDQPSVLSNLALAHAMEGNPELAEPLLKRAAERAQDARVDQNLSLVLGLQGKYAEAKQAAGRNMTAEEAEASVDYVRRIVMLDPQPPPQSAVGSVPAKRTWATTETSDAGGGWGAKVSTAAGKQ